MMMFNCSHLSTSFQRIGIRTLRNSDDFIERLLERTTVICFKKVRKAPIPPYEMNICVSMSVPYLRRLPFRNSIRIAQVSTIHTSLLPTTNDNSEAEDDDDCRTRPRNDVKGSINPVMSNPLLILLQTKCKSMEQLKKIQAQMVVTGLISDGFASSRLISFCANSGDLSYCQTLLFHVYKPNVFSWNVTIRAYSNTDHPDVALWLYKRMLSLGSMPDNHTFPFLLRVCSKLQDVGLGNEILGHAVQLGSNSDLFVCNGLISFFAMCGKFNDARKLFYGSPMRDLVSWNSLINGYARRGRPEEGLELFRTMRKEGILADEVTIVVLVSCCTQLGNLDLGRELHLYAEENGLIRITPTLTNSLMDMYVKCGSLEPAKLLFASMKKKTSVSWTTMIVGYLRFGMVDAARSLSDGMPDKDIVPWNAIITGYVQCKREKEAFALFHEMQHFHVSPDQITMVSLLSACSQIGALDVGIWIHHYIERRFILNVQLGTALVDMYAKCGNITESLRVFKEMPQRNAMTWTAAICGLAAHGHGQEALRYFTRMTDVGLVPDGVTFIGVLSACSHAGLVTDGRRLFNQMKSKYNLVPKLKHYSCMVDLFGRAGLLEDAEQLINSMPMKPDDVVLGALFFACRVHCNVSMGERIALQLLDLDPRDSGIYVLLANMYEEANMQYKADEVRILMRKRQVEKTPGSSSIEVDGIIYEFIVRDKSHPKSKDICNCLVQLAQQMQPGLTY